jgi:splicing suppressor protein 51
MPITILAALEATIPNLAEKRRLTLHLIGVTTREWRNSSLFEELLHLLPSLKSLNIVCVGPNSFSEIGKDTLTANLDLECCQSCRRSSRKRTMRSFRGFYHDFVQRRDYEKPDMAVLFHSGRSQAEQSGWAPTTKALVKLGILTLCTTYNEREAREEVEELDGLGAKVIVRPEVNKWRGLMPTPDFLEGPEFGFFYMNSFWYIFQGKK